MFNHAFYISLLFVLSMKFSRKKRFSKPSVIKQNPALTDYFHRKETSIRPLSLQPNIKQKRVSDFYPSNRQEKRFDLQSLPLESNEPKQPETLPQKNWWIHLWNGLVLDRQAKHKRAIRQAIWLYLYFLLVANRKSGFLYRKLSTIAEETGFNPRSIQRWLQTLRDKGYIETHSTGRALQVSITRWKPIIKPKAKKESAESHDQT